MQTAFTYNGILVKDVCTESMDFSSEKESTGVDQVGIRCQCVFTGVVYALKPASQMQIAPTINHMGVGLEDFRGELHNLIKNLSKDRRRFILTFGRREIINVGPGAVEPGTATTQFTTDLEKMDISNGPHVQVQVTKITAGVSAHIRFTITYTIPNCGTPGKGGPSGLINFRFWIHEEIDAGRTWLTTRTFAGRIRVAHKGVHPHVLSRIVTVPPLENGFKREFVQWDESSDGLHLDFTYRDVEKIASAPWNQYANLGAIDWDGQLTASTNDFGFTGRVDLRLRLTGPKSTSKADLIKIGFLVAESKARFFEATNAVGNQGAVVFLEALSVSEELAENTIGIVASIRHTGGNLISGILSIGTDQILGKPLGDLGIGYNPEKHFAPGPSAGVGSLFLSVLQTPCQPASMPIVSVQRPKKPKVKRQSAEDDDDHPDTTLQSSGSALSRSHLDSMYLDYSLESDIRISTGRMMLATGAPAGSREPTSAIVNLHRPTAWREIRIDASRLHAPPQLPDWSKKFTDANGIVATPIGEPLVTGTAPQVSADGRKLLFRAGTQIVYALSRAPKSGESLPVGCVPYRFSTFSDPSRVLTSGTFSAPDLILR
jgi:hypothetical protein